MSLPRPRTSSALIVAFALLLAACIAGRAHDVSQATHRASAERHAFARYARTLPGVFGIPHVRQYHASDLVCAPHRRARGARPDYSLCAVVVGPAGHPRVTHLYSARSRL